VISKYSAGRLAGLHRMEKLKEKSAGSVLLSLFTMSRKLLKDTYLSQALLEGHL